MKALRSPLPWLLLAVAAMAWNPVLAQARTQARQSAFAEYAEPLRFAVATHALGLRLRALTLASGAASDQSVRTAGQETEEGAPIPLVALFAGSLAGKDPALLQALEADLKAVRRLSGSGKDAALARAVGRVQRKLARVREVLLPDTLATDPAFQAALIAKLANSGRGLGEAYEEAANGEVSVYPFAWLTLQRVEALWRDLAPALSAAQREVKLALEKLHGLMPSPQPPETFSDPEDVEGEALNLVFALEGALKQPLMMRGFAPALGLMQRQVEDTCRAVDAGRPRLALENALAARMTYSAHLASTMATLAPELHADLTALWGKLESLRAGGGAGVCQSLQDAVKRARGTLG